MTRIPVHFYSYFKDLAGCAELNLELPDGSNVGTLLERLFEQKPGLSPMKKSMLLAVGVEYQPRDYVLKPGDEVSLFPPVQGG